jgi:hypothetical protein
MAVGAVVARILTQYSDKGSKAAQKDLMKLGKSFDAYAKKASRAVGLVAVATAAAAVKIGKDSVMAASDVSQQFGALDAVFKSNSKQLKDFAKTMVEYGLSTADSARFSALLGTQLTGLGLSQQDAIERTQKLQILAADLAATYGGTTADAVAALSSTFKGEYNPIERYGVAIRKSDITARVAAKGLKGLTGEALKAAEAQAAYELILTKTTAAQGQSGREFNTLAAQLQRLDASYTNIEASLGEALLPVVQEFANTLLKDVIPQVQAWVDTNRDQLAESLKNAAKLATDFLKVAFKIGQWATDNIGTVKAIAAAIASIFVINKLATFATSIATMVTLLKGLKTQADLTNASTSKIGLLGKVGGAAAVATVAIPGVSALAKAAKNQVDNIKDLDKLERQLQAARIRRDAFTMALVTTRIEELKKEIALTEKLKKEQAKFVGKGTVPYDIGLLTPEEYKATQKEIAKTAALEKAAAAEAAKSLKASIVLTQKDAKVKAAIAKGQAALAKFGIKTSEADPIQLEAARLNLLKQGNLAEAARIALIAKSKDSVVDLAKAWGGTKEQIEMYGDFVKYLNDGKLSDAEIVKLQEKWGLTSKEVRIYSDIITKASDKVLSDAEIIALGTTWGLTTKEVLEYIKKIGQPVVFSGTLIDPATLAAIGWADALTALLAYQAALAGKGTPGASTSSATPSDVAAAAAKAAAAANASASKAAAESYAVAKAAGDSVAAAKAAAGVTPSELAAGESGAIGAASIAAQLRAAEKAQAERSALLALEKQRQQNAIKAQALEDRYGGFGGSSTISNATSMGTGGSSGAVTVNLTVNGSVTTEQDLVQTVRNGLLAGQYNGKQILLQAI